MTVGIRGLGLIGGSFAKAWHEAGHTVLACNRTRAVLDFALMSGEVDGELTKENIPDCEKVEGLLGCGICKNLFLTNRQQTDFYLLIMPGEKPFKTKILSKQIGTARLSFGTPEQMEHYLDTHPGSASVLGLMNDKGHEVRLLVDRDLLSEEFFGCHPCLNTSSLRFRTADLFEKILPAVGHEPTFVDLPWEVD